MAVGFGASDEAQAPATNELTIPLTPSGSDRALYVGLTPLDGEWDMAGVSGDFNGDDVPLFIDDTFQANRKIKVFRLVNPDAVSANVHLVWSGNQAAAAIAFWLTGVDQGNPDDAEVGSDGSGGGTGSTLDVTSETGDMAVDFIVSGNGITGLSATAGGQTEIEQMTGGNANSLGASYRAGQATTTMSWSWTGFVTYRGIGWNVNAATGGGGGGGSRVLYARRRRYADVHRWSSGIIARPSDRDVELVGRRRAA